MDKRVLIVDDSKMTRILISQLLENEGFEATHAEDGDIAVNIIDSIVKTTFVGDHSAAMIKSNSIDSPYANSYTYSGNEYYNFNNNNNSSPNGTCFNFAKNYGDEDSMMMSPPRQRTRPNDFDVCTPNGHNTTNVSDSYHGDNCMNHTDILIDYDVVLIDLVMERLNGPDAIRRMRDLGYTGIIIGMTGHLMQRETDMFIDSGADAVANKPIDVKHFLQLFQRKFLLSTL